VTGAIRPSAISARDQRADPVWLLVHPTHELDEIVYHCFPPGEMVLRRLGSVQPLIHIVRRLIPFRRVGPM
jgi:hypothetical protein